METADDQQDCAKMTLGSWSNYESELLTHMAQGWDRRTGYEEVTGQTLEISEWTNFDFYDLVWWWHIPSKPNITDNPQHLACWLGVSHHVAWF